MKGILIDTSIIIDYLRQKDKSKAILVNLEKNYPQLLASIVTHTECFSGKSIWEKKQALETLKILFSNIKILPLEEKTSEKAGEMRARYDVDIIDAIIAATAFVHKLTLATLNIKDFKKIKEISLLEEKSFSKI